MLVYYFVPFIVSNRYLLVWVSNGRNSVNVQNRTHVYMNFFDHKDLRNHLLQLCSKVVKHSVYHSSTTNPAASANKIASFVRNSDACAKPQYLAIPWTYQPLIGFLGLAINEVKKGCGVYSILIIIIIIWKHVADFK